MTSARSFFSSASALGAIGLLLIGCGGRTANPFGNPREGTGLGGNGTLSAGDDFGGSSSDVNGGDGPVGGEPSTEPPGGMMNMPPPTMPGPMPNGAGGSGGPGGAPSMGGADAQGGVSDAGGAGGALGPDGIGGAVGATGQGGAGGATGGTGASAGAGSTISTDGKAVAPVRDPGAGYGNAVSLSGTTALVGAWSEDDPALAVGAAYTLVPSGEEWELQQRLSPSDPTEGQRFGSCGSIDGTTALVGSFQDDSVADDAGSAYVFVFENGAWTEQQKLSPDDAAARDYFGTSCSLSGNTAVIGATKNGSVGAAYVFTRTGSTWTQQDVLQPQDAISGDLVGFAVALLGGNTAFVGSPFDETEQQGPGGGSVTVFRRNGNNWAEAQTLVPEEDAPYAQFGISLAADSTVNGGMLVVGATSDNDGVGGAYVFGEDLTVWTETKQLVPPTGMLDAQFGISVALAFPDIVVGAYGVVNAGNRTGSAYQYRYGEGTWSAWDELSPYDAAMGGTFGISVAASPGQCVVGSPGIDGSAGAAYFYRL